MRKRHALFAALIVGLLLVVPVSTSYATDCIVLPHKPIRLRRVCGIVLNEIEEQIPSAKVTVLKAGRELGAVQTDADGRFSFDRLEAGNYEVRVEAGGYLAAQDSVVIVRPATKCKRGLLVSLSLVACSGMSRAKH